ncbi:MAG TPA: tRNA dihydrouridine synthase DusB [Elusimicrobia bacterium]|nr:tRNA dihydrouridine synthase DusB [Elusimicrobiota bacterium]
MPLIQELHIGTLKLKSNLFLAPMAGITNQSFRILASEGGAGLVVTEMVSADSIRYANRKSFKMLELSPAEHPVAVQLFGADPAALAMAARAAVEAGADAIDINAGCPVKKILRNGAGAALMKKPLLLAEIARTIRKCVQVPVMVKLRPGWNEKELLSPELAKIMEEEGVAAITLHGRPVANFHSGPINFEALRLTAAAVKIPVIGNGGVSGAPEARAILETGCAGVAIGRGAVRNPAVFREIAGELGGRSPELLSDRERVKLFLRFIELNAGLYGEERGLAASRKLVGYWLKGLPGSAAVRASYMTLKTLKDARALLIQYTEERV